MSIVPGVMAVGLLGESMKMLPKEGEWSGKKKKDKGPSSKKVVKGFVTAKVALPLIGATAGMVNKLP